MEAVTKGVSDWFLHFVITGGFMSASDLIVMKYGARPNLRFESQIVAAASRVWFSLIDSD